MRVPTRAAAPPGVRQPEKLQAAEGSAQPHDTDCLVGRSGTAGTGASAVVLSRPVMRWANSAPVQHQQAHVASAPVAPGTPCAQCPLPCVVIFLPAHTAAYWGDTISRQETIDYHLFQFC